VSPKAKGLPQVGKAAAKNTQGTPGSPKKASAKETSQKKAQGNKVSGPDL
jgi:hypothetical protein